ncbi:acetate--CoA ligase family protein [uncultured Desulfosarcina sp.]|uniref:acetate--CoA ligase family protein n=1 Tax=uncultured Desulfosarcina sp. TaxID=218289 RepID=UPI0029C6BDE7|nr:acetate--CoA ligase family protein [uncultured Desulfosarcina sp.]
MLPDTIIEKAVRNGMKTLTEAKSKRLLANYGIPVVEETVVQTESDAVGRAASYGFPVVLKALGEKLTHKTDRGLVALDLRSESEVRDAFHRLNAAAGQDWEACLVQPMVRGKREFAAGFFRDLQFGPVIMFGLGGIFAEAFKDVVFRMPPLSRIDIRNLVDALVCRKLLFDFRGEAAVDVDQLAQVLNGLSRLAAEHPCIAEVDINPLIAKPDGRIVAVDALIGLGDETCTTGDGEMSARSCGDAEAAIQRAIDKMVHPRSIAVMGAKRQVGKLLSGADLFKRLQEFGFPGRLYPVNPRAESEIHGRKAYRDLFSLPEIPDHVIVCMPATFVPDALRDCATVGCKNIHIFTAGFKETGEAEGLRLQAEIEEIAQCGGLHVIGPNCMGLYVPESRTVTWPEASTTSGPVAFITQSGGHARDFTKFASSRFGIHFSKVVSYGNALTLDCTDFLKYVARDDQTRIVLMYLEGIEDGRTLFDVVQRTSREKPVIIFKAGMTDAGVRVAASHTGALAGSENIWNAFFCQSGAVRATSLEELAALTQAFLHLEDCGGRRVAILGSGGGISVNAADACTRSGLTLPVFPPNLFKMAGESISTAGNIVSNPIDAHKMFFDLPQLGRMMKHLSDGSYVDMFIVSLQLDWLYTDSGRDMNYMEGIATYIATEGKAMANGKPLVVGWRQFLDIPEVNHLTHRIREILLANGVPVYEGMADAAIVLSKLAGYHEFRRQS